MAGVVELDDIGGGVGRIIERARPLEPPVAAAERRRRRRGGVLALTEASTGWRRLCSAGRGRLRIHEEKPICSTSSSPPTAPPSSLALPRARRRATFYEPFL